MSWVYNFGGVTDYADGYTTQGWQPQAYVYGGRITFSEAGEVDQLSSWMRGVTSGATLKFALYDTSENLVLDASSTAYTHTTAQWLDSPTVTAASVAAADYFTLFSASNRYECEYGWDDSNDGSFATVAYADFPQADLTSPDASFTAEGDSAKGYGGRANFTASGGGTLLPGFKHTNTFRHFITR